VRRALSLSLGVTMLVAIGLLLVASAPTVQANPGYYGSGYGWGSGYGYGYGQGYQGQWQSRYQKPYKKPCYSQYQQQWYRPNYRQSRWDYQRPHYDPWRNWRSSYRHHRRWYDW